MHSKIAEFTNQEEIKEGSAAVHEKPITDDAPVDFISAAELGQNVAMRFSTGSNDVDDLLGGGVETGAITQFYGEPGSGKTQLCYTTCVMLTSDYKAIYIDTEGKFRSDRIDSVAKARGLKPKIILQNIQVASPLNSHQQEEWIERACSAIKSDSKIKMLIIDSIINLYKADYPGPSTLPKRQQQLNKYMHMLSNIAQSGRIAVIVTNHIQSSLDGFSSFRSKPIVPAGGNVIAYVTNYTMRLVRIFSCRSYPESVRSDKHMAVLEHGSSRHSN
ncbi:MAG: AAA family ATPase [Thermoproteota archaeon]|nr:AAA family ATPase [Thermoproteota archaeon]